MSFETSHRKNRTCDDVVTLYEADKTTGIALASTDVVRVKVYRRDQATPVLDLDSAAASANGSVVTVDQTAAPAQVTVRVAQGDTASLDPGDYSAEVSVVDDSETAPVDAIKHAERGVFHLLPSGGGDIAKT